MKVFLARIEAILQVGILRGIVCLIMLFGACLSVAGITESIVFSQSSPLKYWASVLAPLMGAVLTLVKRYDLFILSAAILLAPFNYVTTISGFAFTPVEALLVLGVICSRFGPQSLTRRRPTMLMTIGVIFGLTLLGPLVRSKQPMNMFVLAAVVFAMAYLVALSAREPRGRQVVMMSVVASCAIQGGLGIWGAVALGALVAFLKFRKGNFSQPFAVFADAIAPALLVAHGIGRFGNWFNAELFGKPTTLPWGLEIPVMSRPIGFENFSTFHPTFLYEALWCFAGALVLSKAKSMKKLAAGQVFLAYIFLYSLGRIWIESLRIDSAHQFIGLRLNIWVSAVAILLSAGVFLRNSRGSSNRI